MDKFSKQRTGFTQVPNGLLTDTRLSLRAKGLYSLLYSKPDDWVYLEGPLVKESKEGRDAFRSAVTELVENGWLRKRQVQKEDGTFSHTEWLLTVDWKSGDGSAADGESAPTNTQETNTNEQTPMESPTKEPNHGNNRGQRLEAYLASIAEAEWERYRLGEIPIRFYEHGLERGWTDGYIRETFAAFRDYWLAESGAKAVKRDWLAAWRNWCRNEVKFSRGRSQPVSRTASVASAVLAALMGDEGVASGAPETVAGAVEAGEGGADGGWDHLGHSQLEQ